MSPLERLEKLNLELSEASIPGGNYESVNIRGNIAYISIQFPIINNSHFFQGLLGNQISTEEGYRAFQMSALNILAQINSKIGFNKVKGLNHIDAYYCAVDNWDDAPIIVNGASDLFVEVLKKKG